MSSSSPNRRDFLAAFSSAAALAAFGLPKPLSAGGTLQPAPKGAAIARVAVYPPIGVSRVGGSPEWFPAPELPGQAPTPSGGYKDDAGRIKKQVQRFRVYAFDDQGRVIGEVSAQATWSVRVANTKAAWYGFNNPLDMGDRSVDLNHASPGIPAPRRNPVFSAKKDREAYLVIDSGEQVAVPGKRVALAGKFWGKSPGTPVAVPLGALEVVDGRLLVFPSDGTSASVVADNPIVDFTKNDAWYDDWCDGWVKATVVINGARYEAAPGWIVCCGPDFAPEVTPITSLYDTIYDMLVKKHEADGLVKRPALPLSFRDDIYPIFYRLGLMQWVSGAAAMRQGWIQVGDFSSLAYIQQLAGGMTPEQRAGVYDKFRTRKKEGGPEQYRIPYMVGSGVDFSSSQDFYFVLNDFQTWVLQQWVEGNYTNDFKLIAKPPPAPSTLADLPLADQPEALTRAALQPCSGGNFHPGVELTWVLGRPELFDDQSPFRLVVGDRPMLTQDLGPLITPELALPGTTVPPEDRPIGPQMPGDLTRWMGLPWQPDAFSCQNVLYANDFPTLVWWPALLPVDVLTEATYKMICNPALPRAQRIGLAGDRSAWARGAAGIGYHANASYFDGLNRMVYLWQRMGFVVRQPTPKDLQPDLPPSLFVELERGTMDVGFDKPPPNTGL